VGMQVFNLVFSYKGERGGSSSLQLNLGERKSHLLSLSLTFIPFIE